MVIKLRAHNPTQMPLNIKTLSGDELLKFKAKSNAEYLIVELGDMEGRVPHFTDAIAAAMKAAITSLITAFPADASPAVLQDNANATAAVPQEKGQRTGEQTERERRREERLARLNAAILDDAVWLTANDLSKKAGFSSTNPSAGPNRWKSSGKIFAIQLQGKDFYPEYALDEGFHPLPIVKKILSMFGERKTAWGLATWFGVDNGWLGGRKPKDMLLSAPEQVLLAAKEETSRATHG